MYAKINFGVLNYAPKDYIMEDMRVIVDFYNNTELLKEYGYKEVVDNKPEYNPETQYLTISGYIESDNNITIEYNINNKTPDPTIEEKIELLQSTLNNVIERVNAISEEQSNYKELFEDISKSRDDLIELLNNK